MPAPNVPIELREFPEPELEQCAALLNTLYSEVCGTDVDGQWKLFCLVHNTEKLARLRFAA